MTDILRKIEEYKRAEIEAAKRARSQSVIDAAAKAASPAVTTRSLQKLKKPAPRRV